MNNAGSKGGIIIKSWASGSAGILSRDNCRRCNDMFRTVRTVEILALMELTPTHNARVVGFSDCSAFDILQ
jgi:hypothetical protein